MFACVHCVLCFCVSLSLLPCSWEQIVYGSADATPPLRSNGCIVQLLQFVIIYGGRCSGCVVDVPWMFNTVTKSWSRLPSAVIQTSSASVPIPRMQHGCALLPTPGDGTHLSASLYVIGGRGTQSVRRTAFLLGSPPFCEHSLRLHDNFCSAARPLIVALTVLLHRNDLYLSHRRVSYFRIRGA